ncbi:RNA polymerase sigma factor [Sphingobium boeckii]|uniref:RNA polymerase sigma-70 factor (ECF subfamily) n=1 Tax=Sphingobium boeckii TaxID=1082345 RepID=A0A7W9EEW5_9SPHN|nr:RNA polymerase sigma factor [Sphingobium boeckii]MBB5686597.1 RNA polymerase sigma-70 factor (ECF subfamily) [Sphingobium boeckii]
MTANGLEAVFLGNRDVLLRFLRARGGGDAAEDLLQELWLRASSADAGPIAEPLSYLYRIANNLMLDRHRSSVRAQRRDQDWSDSAGGTVPGVSDEPSAERALIARERLREAEAALAALGDRAATVFRRYRIEGVSQRDIAADLGISLSAVEKDLQKAYRAMIDLRRRDDAD